jgi:ABC-2 type transport system ATP-binding protein
VDLDLVTGQVVGFVGPNGAGKTTLLKIMAGLARPTEGEGQVLGLRIAPHETPTPVVGMMVEKPAFIEHLSAVKNLEMLAAIRARIGRIEIEAALHAAGLDSSDRRPVRSFSQGMRQRLSLAQATMEDPRLLLLDEPTNGLDPRGLVEIRGMIRSLAERGATVLLASHLLSEVEAVCERVVLVDRGRIVRDFGPNPTSGHTREIVLQVADEADLAIVAALPGVVSSAPVGGHRVRLRIEDSVPVIVRALVRAGVEVESIHPASQKLEDAYLAAVGAAGEC